MDDAVAVKDGEERLAFRGGRHVPDYTRRLWLTRRLRNTRGLPNVNLEHPAKVSCKNLAPPPYILYD